MTDEQKAAYVIAQAMCAGAEVAGMQAENHWRLSRGEALAYREDAFAAIADKYGIHHNAVLSLFHG